MNSDMNYERVKGLVSTRTNIALVEEYEFLQKVFECNEIVNFAFIDFYLDMLDLLRDELCCRYTNLIK